jgi:hypothetical protein
MASKKLKWTKKKIKSSKEMFEKKTSKCLYQILSDIRRGLPLQESVDIVRNYCIESNDYFFTVLEWSFHLQKDSYDKHAKIFAKKLFGFSSVTCFRNDPPVVLDIFKEAIELKLYSAGFLFEVLKNILFDLRLHQATFEWAQDKKMRPYNPLSREFVGALYLLTQAPPQGYLFNVNDYKIEQTGF